MGYISKEKLKAFLNDTSKIEKAKNTKPGRNMILLDLFMYKENNVIVTEDTAIDGEGKKGGFKYLPMAKVIGVHHEEQEYKVGDIIKLSNDSCAAPINRTAERNAILDHNRHYPAEYRDPGDAFVGGVADLLKRFRYVFNPLSDSELDSTTVILVDKYIIHGNMDISLFSVG